jgi:hypothetical protein
MSGPLNIIIVEKGGSLKPLAIKDYKEEELYKKCGFKKAEDFVKQTEWSIKFEGKRYTISVYAKTDGKANSENKYDFPPPIDTKLFFGNCAIVARLRMEDGKQMLSDLSVPLWLKIYEKLFGGFEDLAKTAAEDENEEDELENVPKEKKTKQGYLKDGFVVDSGEEDNDEECSESSEDEDEDETESSLTKEDPDGDLVIDDIGSELSEESYDYEE